MKKKFDKITNSIIIISCLLIILGIILILYPSISLRTLGIMSAIYLLVHGVTLLSLEMNFNKIFVPFENMLTGVLSIILGIVLFIKPENASVLITVAFGMWIIISSINNIKVAYFFRNVKEFPSVLMIVLGILDIFLGCLVILNPFESSITLTLYLGIMLIVHSVFNIIDMIILKKNVRDKENFIKERISKLFSKFD